MSILIPIIIGSICSLALIVVIILRLTVKEIITYSYDNVCPFPRCIR